MPEFTITSDFGPIAGLFFEPICEATVTTDISFTLSTGEVACIIDSVNTYSTEFGNDDQVTLQDCCAAAVALNPNTIPDDQLNLFCLEEEEITPSTDVEYQELFPGFSQCLCIDGEVKTVWKDSKLVTQKEGNPRDISG